MLDLSSHVFGLHVLSHEQEKFGSRLVKFD